MKICFLCSDIKFGGIQRVAVTLANSLVQQGVPIDFVALRGKGEFRPHLVSSVRFTDLDCTSQPLGLLFPSSPLARYLKEEKPDTVLSFGNSTNNLAAWAKRLLGFQYRLIVSEHSTFGARMAGDAAFHRWRRTVRSRFLYRQAELCLCVSQGVADDLVGLKVVPPEKTRVIYNPVYDSRLQEQALCPVEHPWLQPGNPPVVMSAGRLVKLKGLGDLLKAFRLLRRDWDIPSRLMILGDGPERASLEKLARSLGVGDDVAFVGFQENPYAYMSKASAFALTSHFEGFASVLAEALACGLNVVSTDCRSGPREILKGGKWGRLVAVGDVPALAEALRSTLTTPLPAEMLKRRAEYFSVQKASDAYREILQGKID